MTMTTRDESRANQARRPVGVWLIQAACALLGAWWGYDFGQQVSGLWLGLIAAVNGAVFAALLIGAGLQSASALLTRFRSRP